MCEAIASTGTFVYNDMLRTGAILCFVLHYQHESQMSLAVHLYAYIDFLAQSIRREDVTVIERVLPRHGKFQAFVPHMMCISHVPMQL